MVSSHKRQVAQEKEGILWATSVTDCSFENVIKIAVWADGSVVAGVAVAVVGAASEAPVDCSLPSAVCL